MKHPIPIKELEKNLIITNQKRKLTIHKKKVAKMETAYESDYVESAEEFLSKFSNSK